jgi:phosphoribosylglycinamide formyltransferase-1
VLEDDDTRSLSARILTQEHEAYVEALAKLSRGRYEITGRRVRFA